MAMDTNRKCLAKLRKLGYARSSLQMARNGTTYTEGGGFNGRLSITLGKGSDQFIVTDREGKLTLMSMAVNISNLKDGAQSKVNAIISACIDAELLKPGQTINNFELLVAIAELGLVTDAVAEA